MTWWLWLIAAAYGPVGACAFRLGFTGAVQESLEIHSREKTPEGEVGRYFAQGKSPATIEDADWMTFSYGLWIGFLGWVFSPFVGIYLVLNGLGKMINALISPALLTKLLYHETRENRKKRKALGA